MSCLLPQFKCPPDAFSVNFRTQHHSTVHFPKSKDAITFRMQCILSTASPPPSMVTSTVLDVEKLQLSPLEAHSDAPSTNRPWTRTTSPEKTAVLDMESLKLSSLDAHSNSIATSSPWTYIGAVGPSTEAKYGAMSATETLLGSEEAVIAAAATEAVALAKAAVKVAKDAVMMINHQNSPEDSKPRFSPSEAYKLSYERSLLAEVMGREEVGVIGEFEEAENGLEESSSLRNHTKESNLGESTHEELELLQEQLSNSIAVKSKRQIERKAKRVRAAEKSAANVVSIRSGSTNRKRRGSMQDIDHSDPLRYLRGTTNTSKLLTVTEEQQLSQGIQDLLKLEKLHEDLTERYGGKPSFVQWAAAAGVDQKTLRKRLNYGILCKDRMIKSNIRLVISIAKNYQGAGMNLQDLVQEGCRGLVRGAEKFDASKGFKFSTYAHWWIKQAVRKSLSDQSRTIRLPFHMVEASYRVKEARKHLYTENGRHPDDEEIAEATGLSMKRLSAVLLTPKAPQSLDQKIGNNQDLKPSEVIADPEAETTEDLVIRQFMKEDLAKVLDTLNTREKQVIRWRFGLEDGRMKTLQEIGELMDVSRERIRQIESSAFRKLKNKKRTKYLQQYLIS